MIVSTRDDGICKGRNPKSEAEQAGEYKVKSRRKDGAYIGLERGRKREKRVFRTSSEEASIPPALSCLFDVPPVKHDVNDHDNKLREPLHT